MAAPTIKFDTKTGKALQAGQSTMVNGVSQQAGSAYTGANAYGSGSTTANYSNVTGQMLQPGQTTNYGGKTYSQGDSIIGIPQMAPAPVLAIPTMDTGAVNGMVGNANAGLAVTANGAVNAQTNAQQQEADLNNQSKNNIENMFAALGAPVDNSKIYADIQRQNGIQQKQQQVGDLTGQLNQITAQGQANQLQVTGQGRGIPEAIIGGQQAQIAKETAIASLPVAAQLAAAQGNLEMAQHNIDTLFKIKSADAQAQYEYRAKYLSAVNDVAEKQIQTKIAKIQTDDARAYNEHQKDLGDMRELSKQAVAGGAPASVLTAISEAKNYADAAKAAGKYGGDYLKQDLLKAQLQTERLQQSQIIASTNKTKTETGLLLRPDGSKPPTDAQVQYAGYADRISQANSVIDAKANTFATMNYKDFKLVESNSNIANSLLTDDQRQAAQAMRNFVTAKLRKESGASISQTEFDDARSQYFPALGDDSGTLAQKKALRDSVLKNNILGAGSAYKVEDTSNKFGRAAGMPTGTVPGSNIISITPSGSYNFIIPK